jgi:hypothetical protein
VNYCLRNFSFFCHVQACSLCTLGFLEK